MDGWKKGSTHISGLALLLQDRYLRCKTGLGSRKGRFVPETRLVSQSQYQIGKINSEMYVRMLAAVRSRAGQRARRCWERREMGSVVVTGPV